MIPSKIFFTKGVGVHKDKLVSFELALRDAGIERYNLVLVSSILPPGCEIVSPEEGNKHLKAGEIVFCVMSKNQTNIKGKIIASSIGVAIPTDPKMHGYISEYNSEDELTTNAGEYAEKIALEMLETKAGGIVESKTLSITQKAKNENGEWVTTVAVAVFVP